MENLYPIFLILRDKKCLVVGGGQVATRKVEGLLQGEAKITVVSPTLSRRLRELSLQGRICCIEDTYKPGYLKGIFLVVGAAGEEKVNRRVAADCFYRNILVNIVDAPALCNFFVPSHLRRGPLSIAISTGGKSPAFARLLREEMEENFDETYGAFLTFLGDLRPRIQREVTDPGKRKELFFELAGRDFFAHFQTLSPAELEKKISAAITRYRET